MNGESLHRIQAGIASAKMEHASLLDDIRKARKAGVPVADMEARAASLKSQIDALDSVYGEQPEPTEPPDKP